jgi:hypothetical protein
MTFRAQLAFAAILALLSSPTFSRMTGSMADDGTSVDALRATADLDRIRAARDAYDASRLLDRAAREEMAGRDADAEKLYAKAVDLDSSNIRAVAGLRATRDRLGLNTDGRPLMERVEKERKAKRQETLYRFDAAMRLASKGINAGDPEGFQKARLHLDRARLIRAADPTLFSTEESADLDAKLRDKDVALKGAIQARKNALHTEQQREWARRIKEARVHDISLD